MSDKIIEERQNSEDLAAFFQEEVLVLAGRYFYHGTIEEIGHSFIKLKDPFAVYRTGEEKANKYEDARRILSKKYPKGVPFRLISIAAIDSIDFGRI